MDKTNNIINLSEWKNKNNSIPRLDNNIKKEIAEIEETINYLETFPSFRINIKTLEDDLKEVTPNNRHYKVAGILSFLYTDHLTKLNNKYSYDDDNIDKLTMLIGNILNIDNPIIDDEVYVYEVKQSEIQHWQKKLAVLKSQK